MSSHRPKVVILGLGYIGLPTAAVLARGGHDVVGVDVNPLVVEGVNRGEVHIVEPGLDAMVRSAVQSGRLRAVLVPEPSDVYLIAVPTPLKDGHEPNLTFVEMAAKAIAPQLRPGNLVVLESTSPVGTAEKVSAWLAEERSDLVFPSRTQSDGDVNLAYCPERVLPGDVVTELVNNDRVIGGLTPKCAARAKDFYQSFVRGQCIETDSRTAELTKLTENAFRDVNIAFANELSLICHEMGIDVWELIDLANRHPRVNVLQPGPGVGGHCIAVDPWFIVDSAPDQARLIQMARSVNDSKPEWVVKRVAGATKIAQQNLGREAVVACLGLAFKANIDDLRESPSVDIVARVSELQLASKLLVVEPNIKVLPTLLSVNNSVELVQLGVALNEADIVVLLVDHLPFRQIPRKALSGKVVIDTRGIWR